MQRRGSYMAVLVAVIIIAVSFAGGAWFGYSSRPEVEKVLNVLGKTSFEPEEVDFEPFWKTWRLVEEKYIGDTPVDRQQLVWGAIQGMVASLGDPYTVFFPPKDKEDFEIEIKGEFSGIGAEIGIRKDMLTIVAPLKDSPAEHAGLLAGDRILKIDNTFTSDLSLDEAVHLIRGEKGTKVILTIARSSEDTPREISIVRDSIRLPILVSEKKTQDIYLIQLYNFSANSEELFAKAVQDFLRSGSTKLILDLRNNPGGFFSAAVDIGSWFLSEGTVIAQEEMREGEPTLYRSIGRRVLENVPTVVLVNKGSASASEILAGALQEHGKATLIGEQTFGKGSVQGLENVTGDTSLKVTIAKWLTPMGKSISKEGLKPDIEVLVPEENEPGEDRQLDRAIEYLERGE